MTQETLTWLSNVDQEKQVIELQLSLPRVLDHTILDSVQRRKPFFYPSKGSAETEASLLHQLVVADLAHLSSGLSLGPLLDLAEAAHLN